MGPGGAEKSPLAIRTLKSALNADVDGETGMQELAGNATLLYYLSEEAKEFHPAQREKRTPTPGNFPGSLRLGLGGLLAQALAEIGRLAGRPHHFSPAMNFAYSSKKIFPGGRKSNSPGLSRKIHGAPVQTGARRCRC